MRVVVLALAAIPSLASAQRWQDRTAECLGTTAQWTNKVEVADVDGDGHVDILTANGGNYAAAGAGEAARIWRNLGNWSSAAPHCSEITSSVASGFSGLSRTIKAADVDRDGDVDLLAGGAWQTQAKLFVRGVSGWTDGSAQLPQGSTSIGDAEFGDVDDDGDLDLVLADWGPGNPSSNAGGRTRLYRNDGQGTFTDETSIDMPDLLVRWSWDIELADVDNDFDLDLLIASKSGPTSLLFRNDGTGHFTNDPNALPHFANNYEFEPMDIDADGDLDLITINDGPSITEHLFVNRGDGSFADETSTRLAGAANPANADDNVAVWLDADNDGDPDLVIGSLGTDRLLLNDGTGKFTLAVGATPDDTAGTLGLAIADFDDDGRIDLVQGQGETAFPEKLQLGGAEVGLDTQPPIITLQIFGALVHARILDRLGPSHVHDFTKVVLEDDGTEIPMRWSGGMLWRGELSSAPVPTTRIRVCATDREGNTGCASNVGNEDAGPTGDGGTVEPQSSGGCCDAGRDPAGAWILAFVVSARIRPRARRCRTAARDPR